MLSGEEYAREKNSVGDVGVLYEGNTKRLDEENIRESEDEHLIRGSWGHGLKELQ